MGYICFYLKIARHSGIGLYNVRSKNKELQNIPSYTLRNSVLIYECAQDQDTAKSAAFSLQTSENNLKPPLNQFKKHISANYGH